MPSVVGRSTPERGGTLELTFFIVFSLSPLLWGFLRKAAVCKPRESPEGKRYDIYQLLYHLLFENSGNRNGTLVQSSSG